ncbi:hypothetical protein GCM10017556_02480 [Micromonospora sagamiensis]|nr:hypothetical protein GCM10017556_02480 [Micromonospora sagamiensis]
MEQLQAQHEGERQARHRTERIKGDAGEDHQNDQRASHQMPQPCILHGGSRCLALTPERPRPAR